MREAPPATWLLVRTSPSGATMTPEPEPAWRRALVAHRKADDGRADAVDDIDDGARIGIEQVLVLGRDGPQIRAVSLRFAPERAAQWENCHANTARWPGLRTGEG